MQSRSIKYVLKCQVNSHTKLTLSRVWCRAEAYTFFILPELFLALFFFSCTLSQSLWIRVGSEKTGNIYFCKKEMLSVIHLKDLLRFAFTFELKLQLKMLGLWSSHLASDILCGSHWPYRWRHSTLLKMQLVISLWLSFWHVKWGVRMFLLFHPASISSTSTINSWESSRGCLLLCMSPEPCTTGLWTQLRLLGSPIIEAIIISLLLLNICRAYNTLK